MSLVTLSKNLNFNFQYHEKKTNFVWEIEIWYLLTERKFSLEKSKKEKLQFKLDFICLISLFIKQEKFFFIKVRTFREIEIQSENFEKRHFEIWCLLIDKKFYHFFHRRSIKIILMSEDSVALDVHSLQISISYSCSFRSYLNFSL